MVDQTSRIEIPIEISPSDVREINQLLERIERAESKLFRLQTFSDESLPEGGGGPTDTNPMSEASHRNPRRRRDRIDTSDLAEGRGPLGVSPVEEGGFEEGLGAIGTAGALLLTRREEGALPRGRETPINTGGSAPIQRANQFKKLKEEHDKLKDKVDKLGIDDVSGGTGKISSFFSNPTSFMLALITEAAPVIIPILVSKGLVDVLVEQLTRAGGLFDRRFKILIEKQVVKSLDRERLKMIRVGLTEVRVSTSTTLRGVRGNVANNLGVFRPGGRPVYDLTLENYARGGMQ